MKELYSTYWSEKWKWKQLLTPCDPRQPMNCSRPGYWSGQLIHSPWNLPNPGIGTESPALQADSLPTELSGKPLLEWRSSKTSVIQVSQVDISFHMEDNFSRGRVVLLPTFHKEIPFILHSSKVKKRKILVDQLCLTLCDPMDCSPPRSSVHRILQARILEWVAILSSSRGSNPGLPHCRQILYPLSRWGSILPTTTSIPNCPSEVKWSLSVVSDSLRPRGL